MNVHFISSLLHIASVKIVSYLLQDSHIRGMLNRIKNFPERYNCFDRDTHDLWIMLEKIAVGKLSDLPPYVPNEVSKLIRPMYWEMNAWITDNDLPCGDENIISYMKLLEWKNDGKIDGEKTAKKFIQSGNIPYRECFVIACNYCLKDEILSLWNKWKWWFRVFGVRCITGRRTNVAVRLWIHLMKEGNTKPANAFVEQCFGVQYFGLSDIPLRLSCYCPYLSQTLRWDVLRYCKLQCQDFRLCLHQINEIEREEFLLSNPVLAVFNFLALPYDALFIEVAKEVMTHLTVDNCRCILAFMIVFYILRDWDYFKVFKQFWKILPVSYQDEIKLIENEFKTYQLILNCDEDCQSKFLLEEIEKHFPFTKFYLDTDEDNHLRFNCRLSID